MEVEIIKGEGKNMTIFIKNILGDFNGRIRND